MKRSIFAVLVFAMVLSAASAALAKGDTLIVLDQYDPTTMDPIGHNDIPSSRACLELYDTLIQLDDEGVAQPMLAEKWEFLSDTDYKFYLRQGVKFHNGEEMKAEDVQYSIMRATTEKGAQISTYSKNVDSVEIVDDYTIIIHLKSADYSFFTSLIHSWGSIVSKKAVEEAGDDFSIKPVGTGPFKFVLWNKNDRYVLERFEDYWGKKPVYKTLEVRSVPEPTSRTIELESGGADIAFPIAAIDLTKVAANEKLVLYREPQVSITYMGFNMTKAPFDNVDVRRGIAAALDTQEIHDGAWKVGETVVGRVPTSIVPKAIRYSTDGTHEPHKRDVELAKELLAKGGVKEGFKMTVWTNERKERQDMATMIQAQLEEVGIEAEIKVLEWGSYLNGLRNKEQDVFLLGWSTTVPDANFAMAGLLEGGAGSNYTYTDDELFNSLLVKGRMTPDGDERSAIYHQAQDRLRELCNMIYLHNDESIAGTQKYVKGFKPAVNEIHSFRNVYFEE